MNFFEAQDSARRSTLSLIILFSLAVAALVAITNVLVLAIIAYNQTGILATNMAELSAVFQWDLFWTIAIAISLIIALGSFFKMSMLSSGGQAVAEALGGRLIPQNSSDPMHKKLLNVVEEMAIASGSPVPSVYLLDESGINAFAAGWSPNNAVIGVTRGALTYLTRDELQGVIAHEFSHIFNGDMRLNIRLIGVLHGILLLGILGYYLMRSVRYIGSSRNKEGGSLVLAIFMLGIGLTVIGYCGTFFGQWIKAIVSRQREYLADASAVQYTRNPASIAGALKKIGGYQMGSKLLSPSAPEYSHAYFSKGVATAMDFVFATHPPLPKRIRRIEPRWNGEFIVPKRELPPEEPSAKIEKDKKQVFLDTVTATTVGVAVNEALHAIDKIGQPTDREFTYARHLLDDIPDKIKEEAEDPFGVRALMYCFVIHHSAEVQQLQWKHLQAEADRGVYLKTEQLYPAVAALPTKLRLPIFELCFPALKSLSKVQYQLFKENLNALIVADKKVDIREWVVQRLIKQQVDEAYGLRKPPMAVHSHIGAVKREFELMLSLVAYAEHKDDAEAQQAFTTGIRAIGATALNMIPRKQITITELDSAMDRLQQVKPLVKPRLLKALVTCVGMDNKITVNGAELTRAIASCLGSPMPPITLST